MVVRLCSAWTWEAAQQELGPLHAARRGSFLGWRFERFNPGNCRIVRREDSPGLHLLTRQEAARLRLGNEKHCCLLLAAVHYSVKNVRTAFSLLLLAADGAAHFNIATADGAGNKTLPCFPTPERGSRVSLLCLELSTRWGKGRNVWERSHRNK